MESQVNHILETENESFQFKTALQIRSAREETKILITA